MPVVVEVVIGVWGTPGNYVLPTTPALDGPNKQIKYYTSRCSARASYRVLSIGVRWAFVQYVVVYQKRCVCEIATTTRPRPRRSYRVWVLSFWPRIPPSRETLRRKRALCSVGFATG